MSDFKTLRVSAFMKRPDQRAVNGKLKGPSLGRPHLSQYPFLAQCKSSHVSLFMLTLSSNNIERVSPPFDDSCGLSNKTCTSWRPDIMNNESRKLPQNRYLNMSILRLFVQLAHIANNCQAHELKSKYIYIYIKKSAPSTSQSTVPYPVPRYHQ